MDVLLREFFFFFKLKIVFCNYLGFSSLQLSSKRKEEFSWSKIKNKIESATIVQLSLLNVYFEWGKNLSDLNFRNLYLHTIMFMRIKYESSQENSKYNFSL